MRPIQSSNSLIVSPRRVLWMIVSILSLILASNWIYFFQTSSNSSSQEVVSTNYDDSRNAKTNNNGGIMASTLSQSSSREENSRLRGRGGGRRPSRTLIGIISSLSRSDYYYRKRHRELFQEIWNDTRVCTLDDVRDECQIVYTFIIGAGNQSAPTQLVNNTSNNNWPLLVEKPVPNIEKTRYLQDVNGPDVTLLNIRENMNEGKSESFLYFCSIVMKRHSIDYAMKLDADSILHLHRFLKFSQYHLPPAPYAERIFVGALRDKYYWPTNDLSVQEHAKRESHWAKEFENVHLYLAGQCYLMSLDLAEFVAQEAPKSWNTYREGHEDHDISSMVWHSPLPVTLVTIGKSQRYWEHPVKGQPRWERIRKREIARMKQEIFEGKRLKLF